MSESRIFHGRKTDGTEVSKRAFSGRVIFNRITGGFERVRWMMRCVVVAAAVTGCVKNIDVIEVSSGDTVSTSVRYVALGDSIAYGYGLTRPEKDSYVGKVKEYLETEYDYVKLKNFARNGMQSAELLDILQNPDNEEYRTYRANISYADYITISIGSNDLLHLIEVDVDMEEKIRERQAEFDRACDHFADIFPQIIAEIKKINPDVKIYVNNIYNPARGLLSYASVYEAAEYYICRINQAFTDGAGYRVVDVKAGFDGAENSMINVSLEGRKIDPHPNQKGHELIAKLVIKEMAH